MKHSQVREPLAKVRGLGSAKDGTQHFIWQRITAIVLIPLTFWFIRSLLMISIGGGEQAFVAAWLSSGFSATLLIIMLVALFYHAKLGMQVIIEDYVHSPFPKYTALLLNMVLMYGFAAISIMAVLKLHLYVAPEMGTQ